MKDQNIVPLDKDLLNKEEAAQYISVSVFKLDRLIAKKEIPHYKMGFSKQSAVRFKKKDLDLWIRKFRVESISV